MKFIDPKLSGVLASWSSEGEEHRACCDNLDFEERISPERIGLLEQWLATGSAKSIYDIGEHFRETSFYVDLPLTFTSINGSARVDISPEQKLIRLESLDFPLDQLGLTFDDLDRHINSDAKRSKDLIEWFLAEWNERRDIRKNPISFAAFKDENLDALDDANWPDRLRDKFGLPHFDGSAAPIPVALMEFSAEEVQTLSLLGTLPEVWFCAPTVLDQGPYHQFFPTPVDMNFGSPMPLPEIGSNDDLIAELLHPRVRYERKHLSRVGVIRSAPPASAIANMRNNQLYALQLETNRYDFGREF